MAPRSPRPASIRAKANQVAGFLPRFAMNCWCTRSSFGCVSAGRRPSRLEARKVHVAVIAGLHCNNSDDFDCGDAGCFHHLVHEAVGCPISGCTEVDLAAVGQVPIRGKQFERFPRHQARFDEVDERAGSYIEPGCVLRKPTDVLARSIRDRDRATVQEVSPRSRCNWALAASTAAESNPWSASNSASV